MNSHELARLLLELPNLPVATSASSMTYMSSLDKHTHGPLKVGLLHTYGGDHIVLGNISKQNINPPNWYVKKVLHVDGEPVGTGYTMQAAQPNPWKMAMEDWLVNHALDLPAEDANAKDVLRTITEWHERLVLDPLVSTKAQALIEQGRQPAQAWIPCSERLPDNQRDVLALYEAHGGKRVMVRAQWTPEKTIESSCENDFGEYEEATDTYWDPQGWYEVADNSDYGFFIHEQVLMWTEMPPLPLPPEVKP